MVELATPPFVRTDLGDFVNLTGIAGQNSLWPSEKVFGQHFLVSITNGGPPGVIGPPYYDPSYGMAVDSPEDFEQKSIYAYFKFFLNSDSPNPATTASFRARLVSRPRNPATPVGVAFISPSPAACNDGVCQ